MLGVYYKLQTFIYLTANGIVQGIRPLVGYNYGAGEYDRVKKITHTSMGLIALVMVMGMAISCAIPQQLMGLFTTSRAREIKSDGMPFPSPSRTPENVTETEDTTNPKLMILSAAPPISIVARYIVVMLPVSFVLSRLLQALGVWYGFAVTEYIVAVLSSGFMWGWRFFRWWNQEADPADPAQEKKIAGFGQFFATWLNNIASQGYEPVRVTMLVNDEEVDVELRPAPEAAPAAEAEEPEQLSLLASPFCI